jgi:hypothetical protein
MPGESAFEKQPFPGRILSKSFSICLANEKYSFLVDSRTAL